MVKTGITTISEIEAAKIISRRSLLPISPAGCSTGIRCRCKYQPVAAITIASSTRATIQIFLCFCMYTPNHQTFLCLIVACQTSAGGLPYCAKLEPSAHYPYAAHRNTYTLNLYRQVSRNDHGYVNSYSPN